MRFFVSMAHHQRLLVIGLLSLLLHLLAMALIDARLGKPPTTIGSPALALRLVDPVPVSVPTPAPRQEVAEPPPAPTAPPLPAPPVPPQEVPPPLVAAGEAELPAAPPPAPPAVADGAPPAPGAGLAMPVQMPGTYRVASPPSGRIAYRITDTAAGGEPGADTPSGNASMTWRSTGTSYEIEIDGLLGELRSEGQIGDTGLAPVRTRTGSGLGVVTTEFDQDSGQIIVGPHRQSYDFPQGSQDFASLLLQLAGMGLADMKQLTRVNGELAFWVGGAHGAGIERFHVVGPERIETGDGAIDTIRLARAGKPGEPLLELWLAQAYAWLPVQLRLTAPDGAMRTQMLAEIRLEERGAHE